ncbi:hypothetical protein NDI45_22270 [Leptolyngbya sp. GB1-A1]|uniref:hypothetical protein n=1 Tax=Leptolyngbya sp. GB1-A1 TaxID=2933908 RepID=UPI0032997CD6
MAERSKEQSLPRRTIAPIYKRSPFCKNRPYNGMRCAGGYQRLYTRITAPGCGLMTEAFSGKGKAGLQA